MPAVCATCHPAQARQSGAVGAASPWEPTLSMLVQKRRLVRAPVPASHGRMPPVHAVPASTQVRRPGWGGAVSLWELILPKLVQRGRLVRARVPASTCRIQRRRAKDDPPLQPVSARWRTGPPEGCTQEWLRRRLVGKWLRVPQVVPPSSARSAVNIRPERIRRLGRPPQWNP